MRISRVKQIMKVFFYQLLQTKAPIFKRLSWILWTVHQFLSFGSWNLSLNGVILQKSIVTNLYHILCFHFILIEYQKQVFHKLGRKSSSCGRVIMVNRWLIIFYRILVLLKIVSLATELNVICHISADNECSIWRRWIILDV